MDENHTRRSLVSGLADFRTDDAQSASPDSEKIEQTWTARFYCETFRAWRKSKKNPPLPSFKKRLWEGSFLFWGVSHHRGGSHYLHWLLIKYKYLFEFPRKTWHLSWPVRIKRVFGFCCKELYSFCKSPTHSAHRSLVTFSCSPTESLPLPSFKKRGWTFVLTSFFIDLVYFFVRFARKQNFVSWAYLPNNTKS